MKPHTIQTYLSVTQYSKFFEDKFQYKIYSGADKVLDNLLRQGMDMVFLASVPMRPSKQLNDELLQKSLLKSAATGLVL